MATANKFELTSSYQATSQLALGGLASLNGGQQSSKPTRSWNYAQILLHPKLKVRVFTFSLVRMYLCMAYFGCIFALSSLGGDIYTNSIIAAIAEGLGYTISRNITFLISN